MIALSKLEVLGCGIHIAMSNGPRKAAAVIGREEVRELSVSPPGCDLERLETFRPSRTCVVPGVDARLDGIAAVGITVSVHDEGGSAGTETSHDGDGGD